MKTTIISLLFASAFSLTNNSYAQSYDNLPFSLVKVYENPNNHTVTVAWNDHTIEEIEIYKENDVFMPSFPVFNAKQIHLNQLEDGIYYLNFLSHGEIVQTKMISVEHNNVISKL